MQVNGKLREMQQINKQLGRDEELVLVGMQDMEEPERLEVVSDEEVQQYMKAKAAQAAKDGGGGGGFASGLGAQQKGEEE